MPWVQGTRDPASTEVRSNSAPGPFLGSVLASLSSWWILGPLAGEEGDHAFKSLEPKRAPYGGRAPFRSNGKVWYPPPDAKHMFLTPP